MKLMRQRRGDDCAIACVAMVARVSYEAALAAFEPRPHRMQPTTADVRRALSAVGVEAGRRMIAITPSRLETFDLDALVRVESETGLHWAVWDGWGHRLIDPAGEGGGRPTAYLPLYRRRNVRRSSADWRAADLINDVCNVAGDPGLIDATRAAFASRGLDEAVRDHDDATLYDWLVELFGFQGVSDEVARSYSRREPLEPRFRLGLLSVPAS